MPEEVTFTPGNSPSSTSYSGDVVVNVDGRLANDESGYIIDTDGNRILLGGGFHQGDNSTSGTWQPGDML